MANDPWAPKSDDDQRALLSALKLDFELHVLGRALSDVHDYETRAARGADEPYPHISSIDARRSF